MANAPIPLPAPSDPHAVPASGRARTDSVPECPGCGQAVDPLRAGHVAVLEGRFRYFCRPACKQAMLAAQGRPQEEDVVTQRPPDVALVGAMATAVSSPRPPAVTSAPATPASTATPRAPAS